MLAWRYSSLLSSSYRFFVFVFVYVFVFLRLHLRSIRSICLRSIRSIRLRLRSIRSSLLLAFVYFTDGMVGVVGCLASSRLLLSYVDSVCIGIVFVFIVFSYFLMKRYQSFGDVDWYGSNHAMLIVLYRFRVVLLLSWWHRVYRGGIVFIVMVTDPFGGKVVLPH